VPWGLEWDGVIAGLRDDPEDAIALANADLLTAVRADCEGRIVAGTSLTSLTFTRPGDGEPFEAFLTATHNGRFEEFGGRFNFRLARSGHRLAKLGDCGADEAPDYLASLLSRLVNGDLAAT
jgi:hypothetical protein